MSGLLTVFLRLLLVKGAPDILLGRCITVVNGDGRVSALAPDMAKSIRELKDKWSSDGKRVILLARKVVGTDPMLSPGISSAETEEHVSHEVEGGLTLIGLLALIDPPRPEIPEVMRIMRGAGIRTFMVCLFFTGFGSLPRITPRGRRGFLERSEEYE